jgi:diadenylate cyclase
MLFALPFPVRLIDVIDILIVAFLFYHILLWFKGTVGMQLLRGMLIVLGMYILAKQFNFYTVNWLLERFVTVLLVVVVVVFQPELRRGLERIGERRFWIRLNFLQHEGRGGQVVKNLIDAIESLAQAKIGALIVIEREIGLSEYLDSGIKVDSPISSELIISIFTPRTPLHDGAVIIQGGRIAGAACLLPLSESRLLDKRLGTRHRAAVGMSEQSDALLIVVSERTGIVSVAENGYLVRFMTKELLEEKLFEIYRIKKTGVAFPWFKGKRAQI